MQQRPSPTSSIGRTCLALLGLTLAFVAVLAFMLFLVLAAGDPDTPLLSMAIVSPLALVLILILVMRRSRRKL